MAEQLLTTTPTITIHRTNGGRIQPTRSSFPVIAIYIVLIAGAEIQGTVPMWKWIGDEGATTTFSY
jgi:hypothetical protein